MMGNFVFSKLGKCFEAGRLLIVGSDSYAEDDIFLQNDMMLTFIIIIMSQDNVTDYSP